MSFPQRGYPLGALFVLVTACAVLVAGITPLVRLIQEGQADGPTFFTAAVVGAVLGTLVGLILGLFQFRMGMGIAMGASLGSVLGIICGLISLLRADQLITAALAMTAGSGLIVAVAVIMRRSE
jgi:hypothetical protein